MDVIIMLMRIGKFDVWFFYMVFEEEIGCVKGYFGLINSIVFYFDGKR